MYKLKLKINISKERNVYFLRNKFQLNKSCKIHDLTNYNDI